MSEPRNNSLPAKALPTATVDIDGTPVEVRGLSRAGALKLSTAFTDEGMPDATSEQRVEAAELFIITEGAGVSEETARTFRESNDADTAGLLIDKIIEISGLTEPEVEGQAKGTDKDPKS